MLSWILFPFTYIFWIVNVKVMLKHILSWCIDCIIFYNTVYMNIEDTAKKNHTEIQTLKHVTTLPGFPYMNCWGCNTSTVQYCSIIRFLPCLKFPAWQCKGSLKLCSPRDFHLFLLSQHIHLYESLSLRWHSSLKYHELMSLFATHQRSSLNNLL